MCVCFFLLFHFVPGLTAVGFFFLFFFTFALFCFCFFYFLVLFVCFCFVLPLTSQKNQSLPFFSLIKQTIHHNS